RWSGPRPARGRPPPRRAASPAPWAGPDDAPVRSSTGTLPTTPRETPGPARRPRRPPTVSSCADRRTAARGSDSSAGGGNAGRGPSTRREWRTPVPVPHLPPWRRVRRRLRAFRPLSRGRGRAEWILRRDGGGMASALAWPRLRATSGPNRCACTVGSRPRTAADGQLALWPVPVAPGTSAPVPVDRTSATAVPLRGEEGL